ncbi:MAG: hypothetical protein IT337_14955, partial [Thermomicrobiales bacterium]|nr:hypothetical protein [Thermomicrobiales bacterium]
TVNNAYIGADGAASTADGSGGDENAATSGGDLVLTTDESRTGAYVGAGNGGSAESDASGGGFSSPLDPDGNPIPIVETGDNAGSSIAVGNVVAGDGTTLVEIYGGDTAVAMDTSFSVSGGIADADASGGDRNAAAASGATGSSHARTVAAGDGGSASASATGGSAPIGTILGGRNRGAVIDVGSVTGGSGSGAGDALVRIHGGAMNVATISTHRVATGGFAVGHAMGGSGNVALINSVGPAVAMGGNGGDAASEANGGVATIGRVNGELFSQIGGWNRGATISLGAVNGGDGAGVSQGGDATVGIYGGDIVASATSLENPAYAAMNVGANITAQNVVAGDGGAGGQGGDATLFIDAGSIAGLASAPAGADAGDNVGSRIMAGNVIGGDGESGIGGDATVLLDAGDTLAAGNGFEITAPESSGNIPTSGPGRGASASAGDGGVALAAAEAGSAATGKIFAGDNRGTTMMIGDVLGGTGIGGEGGDATVAITATNITALFEASVNVDGGAAAAEAAGGAGNTAASLHEGARAAAGTGGVANADARGGVILIGDIYLGGNDGGVISVGPVTGGSSRHGIGGDATVRMDGGSIVAAVILDLEAKGGEANAAANGGSFNAALIEGDGTTLAGTGGIATANAQGGLIRIGDIEIGKNSGASLSVGATTGGDGSWGGVGGDATLRVDATDIAAIVELHVQANGGVADARANGGGNNVAGLHEDGRVRSERVAVLSGTGGVSLANANGGEISIGHIQTGRNIGSVVRFGNIAGRDAGAGEFGRSDVNSRFGGTLTVTTIAVMRTNGGESNSIADGGSNNVAMIDADATTTIGVVVAGAADAAVSEANGGAIGVSRIDAGKNAGAPFLERDRETSRRGERVGSAGNAAP